MIKRKILLALSLLMTLGVFGQKYQDLSQPIPFDPEFRVGVLPNGLTYYIRHNEQPKERASFYMIQNVGAVLENEEQDGLAHFLEHMAFNGTENFPGKGILNTLEHHGVKFGREINAYTATNETVYNLSNVPATNEGLLDTCLLILHDWSDFLLLTDEELDAERGVISEEWRTRRNVGFRMRAQSAPYIYGEDNMYAIRDVIGSLDVIKTFEPETIKAFYHDWYRTDLQAIAIVGDIDVDAVEAKVKTLFGAIEAVEDPKPRPFIELDENRDFTFATITDKEATSSYIQYIIYYRDSLENNMEKVRQSQVHSFFNSMINARLSERIQKGEANYLGGGIRYSGFVRGYDMFSLYAAAREGQEAQAFEEVYAELQRVLQHGFTQTEFDRVLKNKLVGVEESYKKRDQITNEAYCQAVKSAYLSKSNISSSDFDYEFMNEILPTITLAEVNALAATWLEGREPIVLVNGPEKEGIHITEDEFLAITAKVDTTKMDPYVDEASGEQLMDASKLAGGQIVATKPLPEFDAVEWTLSNGAKVIYRFADFEKETIALSGYSWGGSSLYENEDIVSVSTMDGFVKNMGIGEFDAATYRKLLPGNTAATSFNLGTFSEGIGGSCSPKDFETMMQLVYMRFEEPRFDKADFDILLDRYQEALKNRKTNPDVIKGDTLSYILTQGNPRVRKFDQSFIDDLDYDKMVEVYKERFADASDFTFFIVGDISEDSVKPMVEKYIGSITDIDREENWVDRNVDFPKGKTEMTIPLNLEIEKSTVVLKFNQKAKYEREEIIYNSILGSILNLRFTESIREKEGGTYGVSVRPGSSRLPEGEYELGIQFDCDPEKAEHLKALVYKELETVQKAVSEEDLKKVVLNMKKNAEQARPHNNYWMGALSTYYQTGYNKLDPSYFEEIVDNVTTKDIAKYAKQFFKKADVVDIIFYPQQ